MTSTEPKDPNIGQILAGRYKLTELIGKGAMGRVYRAEDVLLGGVIAVKFLAQTLLNSKMRDRFKAEARTCAQLGQKSIHIVRVTDYGVNDEDIPFYVMEYLHGHGLSEIIGSQQLPLPRFLNLTRQICLGLQCAHRGITVDGNTCPIIHRDIKPGNILVCKDASFVELVKILDFGISKVLQANENQTGSYMGTLAYSSPEQMEGRELDARSDIYSLGVMMFEMLTGKMPLAVQTHSFGGWYKAHHHQAPRSIAEASPRLKIPKPLEELVMSCLAKSPGDRPQTIDEVLRALQPLEQRYESNLEISRRIGETLVKKPPVIGKPQIDVLTGDSIIGRACQLATWPSDKPVAQIVFPQPLTVSRETLATLWVMLPEEVIQHLQTHRLYNRIYKNFLCSMSPHPVILWVTAIHNSYRKTQNQKNTDSDEKNTRWLRCYLDLKTDPGQDMTRLLGSRKEYQILMFALENPTRCAHGITVPIHPSQCSQLQHWAITSQPMYSVGDPTISKRLLQSEFEKLKPRVETEMETTGSGLSFRPKDEAAGG